MWSAARSGVAAWRRVATIGGAVACMGAATYRVRFCIATLQSVIFVYSLDCTECDSGLCGSL